MGDDHRTGHWRPLSPSLSLNGELTSVDRRRLTTDKKALRPRNCDRFDRYSLARFRVRESDRLRLAYF